MLEEIFAFSILKLLLDDVTSLLVTAKEILTIRREIEVPHTLRGELRKTSTAPEEYLSRAYRHLAKALKLYHEGLEDEACEEAWRATVSAFDVIPSLLWGKRIRTHRGMNTFQRWLREEFAVDIASEYNEAYALHSYYYSLDVKPDIERGLEAVSNLIRKIEQVYEELRKDLERESILPVPKVEFQPPQLPYPLYKL